jgi:hypothetical protein
MAKSKLGASLKARAKAALAQAKAPVRSPPLPQPLAPPPAKAPLPRKPRPKATAKQVADSAFAPFPKRAGAIPANVMDRFLSSAERIKARYDHRVAQNAEDQLLRGFQAAHVMAQQAGNPVLAQTFFPGLRPPPLPRMQS